MDKKATKLDTSSALLHIRGITQYLKHGKESQMISIDLSKNSVGNYRLTFSIAEHMKPKILTIVTYMQFSDSIDLLKQLADTLSKKVTLYYSSSLEIRKRISLFGTLVTQTLDQHKEILPKHSFIYPSTYQSRVHYVRYGENSTLQTIDGIDTTLT